MTTNAITTCKQSGRLSRRPRARGRQGEVKIGSYELFRREEDQQKRVWEAITRGLTTRGYGPTVRESEKASRSRSRR